MVISYTLASASLVLVFGRLGDIIGHRRIFLIGTGWSAAAFLLETASPGFGWLLGGRVLQGIGAGLVMSCGPALFISLYPDAMRPRAVALYTIAFGAGGALGPIAAGLLLTRFDWSCVFWARAPLAVGGFLLGWRLPPLHRAEASRTARFDWTGAALLVLGLSGLVLALGNLGRPVLAAGAGAVALLMGLLFIRQEGRTASPIIRLTLFHDFDFSLLNAGSMLVNMAGFAVLLLVPFTLASFVQLSEIGRGLVLAASPVAIMLAAPPAARVLGTGRTWPLAGGALLAGAGLLAIGMLGGSVPLLVGAMFVQGLGLGLFQVAYLDRVTRAVPREDHGVAGSLAMLTRSLGIVVGAALLMRLFGAIGFAATFVVASVLPLGLGAWWSVRRQ